ncbi:MAG: hypothetical protein ACUVUG_03175 [Candidatus Aminicenantia bacterium]
MERLFRAKIFLFLLSAHSLFPSFTGYFKLNTFYLDYEGESSFVHLGRLRLKFEENYKLFSIKIHSETDFSFKGTEFYSLFTGTLLDELNPFYIYRKEDLEIYHFFDRFSASYDTEKFNLTVGRQRIPWGKAKLFSPLDFFNPFNPFAIDKEEKQGVDSFRAQFYFNGFNWMEGVYARREEKDFYGISLFLTFGSLDTNIALSFLNKIPAFGFAGEWSGGRAVIRGEFLLKDFAARARRELSFGGDLLISQNFFVSGEYYSSNDSDILPAGDLLALSVNYKISELSSFQAGFFQIFSEKANFLFLYFSHSLSSNTGLHLGLLFSEGRASSFNIPKLAFSGFYFYF